MWYSGGDEGGKIFECPCDRSMRWGEGREEGDRGRGGRLKKGRSSSQRQVMRWSEGQFQMHVLAASAMPNV